MKLHVWEISGRVSLKYSMQPTLYYEAVFITGNVFWEILGANVLTERNVVLSLSFMPNVDSSSQSPLRLYNAVNADMGNLIRLLLALIEEQDVFAKLKLPPEVQNGYFKYIKVTAKVIRSLTPSYHLKGFQYLSIAYIILLLS